MNRRQAVAELVGDAGGELAKTGQAVFQPELFFELHHFRQVREETHGAVRAASLLANRQDSLTPR